MNKSNLDPCAIYIPSKYMERKISDPKLLAEEHAYCVSKPFVMHSAAGYYIGSAAITVTGSLLGMMEPYDRYTDYMSKETAIKAWKEFEREENYSGYAKYDFIKLTRAQEPHLVGVDEDDSIERKLSIALLSLGYCLDRELTQSARSHEGMQDIIAFSSMRKPDSFYLLNDKIGYQPTQKHLLPYLEHKSFMGEVSNSSIGMTKDEDINFDNCYNHLRKSDGAKIDIMDTDNVMSKTKKSIRAKTFDSNEVAPA